MWWCSFGELRRPGRRRLLLFLVCCLLLLLRCCVPRCWWPRRLRRAAGDTARRTRRQLTAILAAFSSVSQQEAAAQAAQWCAVVTRKAPPCPTEEQPAPRVARSGTGPAVCRPPAARRGEKSARGREERAAGSAAARLCSSIRRAPFPTHRGGLRRRGRRPGRGAQSLGLGQLATVRGGGSGSGVTSGNVHSWRETEREASCVPGLAVSPILRRRGLV